MAISTTYVPIETYTLGSAASSVTFGSGGTIPQTYTDLIIVCNFSASSSNVVTPSIRFNGDTGSNYSNTTLYGTGSTTTSVRYTNQNKSFLGDFSAGVTTYAPDTYIIQVMNYSNSTTYKTFLTRYNQINSSNGEVGATAGLWRNTNTITSITILSDGGQNYAVGSTFTLYGIQAVGSSSSTPKASGGTITTDMLYTYHTFTSGGTFTPSQDLTADVLIVGGGGGSGDANAGGGGAGGVIYAPARSFTNATAYAAVIGAGGGANAGGVASTFNGLSATGGGYSIGEGSNGTNGGSGGGGGGGGGSGATFAAGISTGSSGADYTFYGNSGGLGRSNYNSGGGGGAGAVGSPAKGQDAGSGAGDGGVGLETWSSWLTATSTGHNVNGVRYIAGGGGGGANSGPVGVGGYGGGGTGKSDSYTGSQTPGTANTGGGAGGSGGISSRGGTNGGSGLIIIRYLNA